MARDIGQHHCAISTKEQSYKYRQTSKANYHRTKQILGSGHNIFVSTEIWIYVAD